MTPPIPKTSPIRLKGKQLTALRAQVFERDGYLCQHEELILRRMQHPNDGGDFEWVMVKCYRPVTWDTGHLCHRKSRGAGGSDTLENTFCGCESCHIGKQHAYGPSMTKPCKSKERGTQ